MSKEITRRSFLRNSAVAAIGILAAACAQPASQVIEKPVTVVVEKKPDETVVQEKVIMHTPTQKVREAPMSIPEPTDSQPEVLPTLRVWHTGDGQQTFLSSTFPEPLRFTCDTWCYENSILDFDSAQMLEGGVIQLRHRWRYREAIVITKATPKPQKVELVAWLEDPASGERVDTGEYPNLNACWQLRYAPSFASKPGTYPDFIKRCFIFTDRGLTFLDQTTRFKIPTFPADHIYNNPPWVQMYLPVWEPLRRAEPNSWADYSTDRYIYPIIGAVSRDGEYLAALATEESHLMCQAWHDCMHNNATWLPAPDGVGKIWRLNIYVLRNDPEELLRRVAADFPRAMELHRNRVPG